MLTARSSRPSARSLTTGFVDGRRSRLFLPFHLSQALLERRHEVNHRGELLRFLYFRNLAAFQLGLDQVLEIVLEAVVIFLGLPLGCQRFNQLMRNFDFRIFQFNIGRAEALDLAYLLLVIHGVQHHSAFVRTQKNRVLAVVHGQLRDGNIFTLFHRLGQQRVWPPAGFIWNHVVGRFEEDRIDLGGLDEFENLHGLGGLGLDLFYFLGLDHYILVLAILVPL